MPTSEKPSFFQLFKQQKYMDSVSTYLVYFWSEAVFYGLGT